MDSGDTGAEQLSHLIDAGIDEAEREIPKRRLIVMPEALKMKFETWDEWRSGDRAALAEQLNEIVRLRRHIEPRACVVEQQVVGKVIKSDRVAPVWVVHSASTCDRSSASKERTRGGFVSEGDGLCDAQRSPRNHRGCYALQDEFAGLALIVVTVDAFLPISIQKFDLGPDRLKLGRREADIE